jgi:hypothetical protein
MRDGLVPGEDPRLRSRTWGTRRPVLWKAKAAAFEVGEGGLVGGDEAGAGSGFDAHVADGHAAFHGEGADGGAGVFDDVAGGAVRADAADDVEDDVLGGDAEGKAAVDSACGTINCDAEGFGRVAAGSAWRDVLDLGGADAEGERPEGSVGGGVRVAADDGAAGLGGAEFGADHVDDALVAVLHVEELDAELGAVLTQRVDLRGGDLVGDDEAVLRRRWWGRCGRPWRWCGRGGGRLRPATRRPSNACGEVTSWTRWRSM